MIVLVVFRIVANQFPVGRYAVFDEASHGGKKADRYQDDFTAERPRNQDDARKPGIGKTILKVGDLGL